MEEIKQEETLFEKASINLSEEEKLELDNIFKMSTNYEALYIEAKKLEKAYDSLSVIYGRLYGSIILDQTK